MEGADQSGQRHPDRGPTMAVQPERRNSLLPGQVRLVEAVFAQGTRRHDRPDHGVRIRPGPARGAHPRGGVPAQHVRAGINTQGASPHLASADIALGSGSSGPGRGAGPSYRTGSWFNGVFFALLVGILASAAATRYTQPEVALWALPLAEAAVPPGGDRSEAAWEAGAVPPGRSNRLHQHPGRTGTTIATCVSLPLVGPVTSDPTPL